MNNKALEKSRVAQARARSALFAASEPMPVDSATSVSDLVRLLAVEIQSVEQGLLSRSDILSAPLSAEARSALKRIQTAALGGLAAVMKKVEMECARHRSAPNQEPSADFQALEAWLLSAKDVHARVSSIRL